MALDQTVTYKANIDDSDFQAKLSQMRASLDMTLGGMQGFGAAPGGMPMSGFASGMMMGPSPMTSMGMMGMMGMPGSGQYGNFGLAGGNLADFGSQIRPVTYTPPAIAMQPHFGMVRVQQTLGQAIRGTFANVPGGSLFSDIPEGITAGEYAGLSAMQAGSRFGEAAMIGAGVTASTAAQLGVGAAGYWMGERVMTGISHSAAGALAGEAGLLGRGLLTAGGLAGSMLATLPITEIADATMEMAAENRRTQNALMSGSFRFISGGPDVNPLTGRGFSARARADVADFIQSRELQDPRYGMKEMSDILETGMQMDMFSGTRDAEDFKKKFSALVENVKTVTSVLHTSVKEGVEMIRGFRDMGVTDPTDVNRMVLGAEAMGRASGRTGSEMLALGQMGAEMFRGTGITMARGADMMMENVMNIRSALNAGTLSREIVAQAGGENSLAQQMTASTLASFQTGVGRGALMAGFNPATGQLDPNRMFAGGGLEGMLNRASSLGPSGMLTLQAHQAELISELSPQQMQMFQIDVLTKHGRMFQAAAGVSGETGFLLAAQQQNIPETVARAMLSMGQAGPEAYKEQQHAAVESVANQQIAEDFRNRFNIRKQVSNFLRGAIVQPLQRGLTSISNTVEQAAEDLGVSLTGGEIMSRDRSETAIRRGQAAGERGSYIFAGEEGIQRILPGKFAGHELADLIEGGESVALTAAEEAAGIERKTSYRGAEGFVFKDRAAAEKYAETHREKVVGLRSVGLGGAVLATTQGGIDKIHKEGQKYDLTAKEREGAEKYAAELVGTERFQKGLAGLGQGASLADFARLVVGGPVDPSSLSKGDFAKVQAMLELSGGEHALPGVAKEIRQLGGQAHAGATVDAAAAARADKLASDEQRELSRRLGNIFTGRQEYGAARAIGGFNREELALFGEALGGGEAGAAAVGKLAQAHKELGVAGIQKMIGTARAAGGGLQSLFQEFERHAADAADFASKSRDPDSVKADAKKATTEQAGFISQETRAVMDTMSKFMEQNIQVLTRLHALIDQKVK